MGQITGDWQAALKNEFHQPYYAKLYKTIMEEYRTTKVFPPPQDMFNAFEYTPLNDVKVVILGQDPYHNDGQANGLCFSVREDIDIPPSLVNIYKELHSDLGCYIPDNGCLEKWAKQGVFLLNTVLTVRAHQAFSHRGIGWEQFTDAVIQTLNDQDRPIVYLLWGRPAQMKKAIRSSWYSQLHIQARCLRQEDFSDAGISARPMNFWRKTGLPPLTGRLKISKRNNKKWGKRTITHL